MHLRTATRMSWRVVVAIAALVIFGPALLLFDLLVVALAGAFAVIQSIHRQSGGR